MRFSDYTKTLPDGTDADHGGKHATPRTNLNHMSYHNKIHLWALTKSVPAMAQTRTMEENMLHQELTTCHTIP